MCVAGFLIWNATFMGRKFDEYTKSGYVVGSDEDEDAAEQRNVEIASRQNKVDDTSCALDDKCDDDDDLIDREMDDKLGVQEEGQDESEHSASENSQSAKVTMV
jgi:AAA family ATP:ADP antiporter